ncbi:MAG: arginine decarboxylase, partial [Clostridiales bacterium]|nr:arginine decarboxylase [Clostridiales bacterium]
ITCDCDGKIDSFIDLRDISKTLPLHELKENENYYIGIFLVGAYQETLGDLHNMFGDTNVVSVRINKDNSYDIFREIKGDSVETVLSYVEYNPVEMRTSFARIVEESFSGGLISKKEKEDIIASYENGLAGYTYYEH